MGQIFRTDDHDTIVGKFVELIRKNNPDTYKVLSAPTGDAPELGGITPDIVLRAPKGKKVLSVIEIETVNDLDAGRAETRWKPLAASAPELQIAVPKGSLQKARRLCKKAGVKAKVQEY